MDKNERSYSNKDITVHWKPSECVHSTICYVRLRKVFDPSRRPWIKMDEAPTDKIVDIVNQCPTDALTFEWNKGKKEVKPKPEIKEETAPEENNIATKIQVMKDGPTIINGKFIIQDIDGNNLAHADTVALCRCGNSSNMPFCDGTHKKIGFKEKR